MNKPKSINEWLKNLSSDEIEKIANEMIKLTEQEEQDLWVFKNSPRFQEIISQIKQRVVPDKSLSDNVYQEPLFGDVSNEEFVKVFSVLFNEKITPNKIEKLNSPFYTEKVIYQDLTFLEIHGQGTAFIVQGPQCKDC